MLTYFYKKGGCVSVLKTSQHEPNRAVNALLLLNQTALGYVAVALCLGVDTLFWWLLGRGACA